MTSAQPAADAPLQSSGKQTRIGGLDGLRAVSIALVIFSHVAGDFNSKADYPVFVFNLGACGVGVFFVISGFLITSLLLNEQHRTGRISLRQFYLRRAFRILPAAIVFLGVISVLVFLGISSDTPRGIFAAFAFFRNLTGKDISDTSHFWSLSIEEQYYLLWPLVFAMAGKNRRLLVVFALIALMPIWRHMNQTIWGAASIHDRRLDLLGDQILTGCLLALLHDRPRWREMLAQKWITSRFAAAACVIMLVGTQYPRIQQTLRALAPIVQNACVFVLVNFAVADSAPRPGNFLNQAWLMWIGRLSYSLYLWQQPFCVPSASLHCRFPLNVTAALCAAAASYYLVEQPFLRLRSRLIKRGHG